MNIKVTMCRILRNRKEELGLTYKDLEKCSELAPNQLSRIFVHDGEGISLDNIEMVAYEMGVSFELHEVIEN